MDNKLIAIRERKTCLMKNKLLITTALVATAFVVNSAMAEQLVVNSDSTETVSENMAGNKSHLGGAIYNLGELTVKEGVSFEGNSAHQGGAIYGANGSTNTLENNVSFIGNKAHLEDGPGDAGGAIYLSGAGSKLTAGDNISFKGNEALQEKFEYADGGVAKGAAGAIYAYDSTVELGNGATFENNKSRYAAGAVYNWNANQGSFEFGDEAKFLNNESLESYGGAIGNFDGDMTIGEKAVFNGNKAGAEGGAIANMTFSTVSSSLEINDGTSFTNNTAGTKGGAIYNSEKGSITFNGTTTFSGNKANGKLNDIHNEGIIKLADEATLILDGGITGNGTTTFADGSNLTVNAGTTTIANNVINNGATLNLKMDNGFTGKYHMVTGSLDKEFDITENNLYNIVADTSEAGTYNISKKSSDEVAAAVGATGNQASAITAVTSGESDNATFNTIANNINSMLQSSNAGEVKAGLDAVMLKLVLVMLSPILILTALCVIPMSILTQPLFTVNTNRQTGTLMVLPITTGLIIPKTKTLRVLVLKLTTMLKHSVCRL